MSPAKHGLHIGIMTQAATSAFSHFWFLIDNSCRDASIAFKLYRRVKHHLIQAKVEKGDNPQNFG